jgi:CRISPR-associated protein Cmr5
MKRIDVLIPTAIEAITKTGIPNKESGIVPNEYKGYIDTFGASIVQNGLIPAIIFFETSEGKEGDSITSDPDKRGIYENRNKLMKAILHVILKNETRKPGTLFQYVMEKKDTGMEEKQIRQKVVDAAAAIKLALRTFAIAKKNENEESKR